MNIEIRKSDATIVIEGDEAKFAEMVAAHGAGNVTNLDAVAEEPVVDEVPAIEEVPPGDAPVGEQDPEISGV